MINEYTLMRRSRHAPAIVALAGPVTNLILGLIGALPIGLGMVTYTGAGAAGISLYEVLLIFSFINFVLFFFNLIPLFPLDGEKVLIHLVNADWQFRLMNFRTRFQTAPLMALVLISWIGFPILSWLIATPARALLTLIAG
jgi:Zn-dependent protease